MANMEKADILRNLQACERVHGEWTSHCVDLGEGVHTIEPPKVDTRLRRIVQTVHDLSARPLAELRVLDLACLEGIHGIEFALQGAEVLAIEGREANVAKTRLACEILGLKNLRCVQDDVRNLSVERYGEFDVVICSGILYHLEGHDAIRFMHQVSSVCTNLAVVDTYVTDRREETVEFEGRRYCGFHFQEHPPASGLEERLPHLWTSLYNNRSFHMTKPSLLNLMGGAGFSSVYECFNPTRLGVPAERITLVGVKGKCIALRASPRTNDEPDANWPEDAWTLQHASYSKDSMSRRHLRNLIATPLRSVGRNLLPLVPTTVRCAAKRVLSIRTSAKNRFVEDGPWSWAVPWKWRKGPPL